MRIEVTAEDIANGKPGSTCRCPVALACERAGLVNVDVYPGRIGAVLRGGWIRYGVWNRGPRPSAWLPSEATDFALDFDSGRSVQPFAFDLDVQP